MVMGQKFRYSLMSALHYHYIVVLTLSTKKYLM